MAAHKQQHTPRGRRELALHAATYATTQAATKATFYRTAGVRVPLLAQVAGAVVEGVLHAVIDDGRLLARFSQLGRGLARFVDGWGEVLGRQERFHALASSGVNGRMLMDLLCTKVRFQRFMTWSTRGCKPAPRVAVTAEPNCVELIGIAAPSGPELTKRLGDRGAGVRQRFRCGQTQRTKDHLAAVPHLHGLCPCTAEVVSLDIGHGTLRRASCQRAAEASGRLPEPVEFRSPSDRDRAEERVRHGQQPQALAKGHDARLRHGPGQLAKHGFDPNDCFQAIHVPILVEPQVARQTQPARSGGAR